MSIEKVITSEDKQIRKMGLLPHVYKKIGLGLLLVAGLAWAFIANSAAPSEFLRVLAQNGVLIGLLLLSVSKDKTEDELTIRLRVRSLSLALVIGVIYAVGQPYVNYFVAMLLRPEDAAFSEMSVFIVLWFMLVVQLGFFQVLKMRR